VAGDVHEEVASLGERVAHLHHTLTTHFSPRLNPYLHKPRLTQPSRGTNNVKGNKDANTSTPNYQKTQELKAEKGEGSSSSRRQNLVPTLNARQENLRRVYPVKVVKPSKEKKEREALVAADGTRVRLKNTNSGLGDSHHRQIHYVYPGNGLSHLSVNGTGDPWRHRSKLLQGLSSESSGREAERAGKTDMAKARGGERQWLLELGDTGDKKARGWSSNLGEDGVRRAVSVVVTGKEHAVDGLLDSLGRIYPGITVHLVTITPPSQRSNHQIRLIVHKVETNTTNGVAFTEVLRHITTPYVLIASGMASITPLSKLERLVWAAEHLGVWAVGGGVETPSGRWRTGCLTSSYAHYQASWTRGRLGIAGECLICQGLEGPFLAMTTALRHLGWDTKLPREVLELDLFLRAAHSLNMMAASCPKSLFTIDSELEPPSRPALLSLARHHSVYSLQAAGGVLVTFSCSEVGASCGDTKLALPPCCRQELASLVRFLMDTCEAHGLLCELQEGTLLGAVKLEGVMPWERDADITFHTKNFTALGELKDVFDRAGYSLYLS
ncbi:Fukutin-related protein-like 3, partial [Homarus americanus]